MANHAVHLRAAFCAVWCNRVVLRARLFARGERGVSAARDGRGHLNLIQCHPILFRALLEVGCKRIVRIPSSLYHLAPSSSLRHDHSFFVSYSLICAEPKVLWAILSAICFMAVSILVFNAGAMSLHEPD